MFQLLPLLPLPFYGSLDFVWDYSDKLVQEKVKPIWINWSKSAHRPRQITTPASHHSVFTGQMPFLPPNQQFQST